jgi:hypothetical protein
MKKFKNDTVDIERLVREQDISQVLKIIEFSLIIVVKQNPDLLENITQLNEVAMNDFRMLVEGTVSVSEYDVES